jgi:hypothetical protein
VHYLYDFNRADEDYWSFNGYSLGAEVVLKLTAFDLPSPLYVSLSGEYEERNYREQFPSFGESRRDWMQEYSLGLTYLLTKRIALSVREDYTMNNSNLSGFDYSRSITGIFVSLGVL